MTSNAPEALQQQPNQFTLRGENKQIEFSTTSITSSPPSPTGEPILTYKDGTRDLSFHGDEVNINETRFGKLATVLIDQVPDSHVVYLTLLVPTIYLPRGAREFPVKTTAIVTKHQTPFVGPQGNVNGLQVDTYETVSLEGTARLVTL